MSTGGVIPTFDELEDGRAYLALGTESVTIKEFALQRSEQALTRGVIVATGIFGPLLYRLSYPGTNSLMRYMTKQNRCQRKTWRAFLRAIINLRFSAIVPTVTRAKVGQFQRWPGRMTIPSLNRDWKTSHESIPRSTKTKFVWDST
jgi:hypothetical protein